MFPLVFRILTIAGSAVVVGLITRAYVERRGERARDTGPGDNSKVIDVEAREVECSPALICGPAPKVVPVNAQEESASNQGAEPEVSQEKAKRKKGRYGSTFKVANAQLDRAAIRKKAQSQPNSNVCDQKSESSLIAVTVFDINSNTDAVAANIGQSVASEDKDLSLEHFKDLAMAAEYARDALEKVEKFLPKAEKELDNPTLKEGFGKTITDAAIEYEKLKNRKESFSRGGAGMKEWQELVNQSRRLLGKLQRVLKLANDELQAAERAKSVIGSSKQLLEKYQAPTGLSVDVVLATDALKQSEALMQSKDYVEAWEKAGAVGMLLGLGEIRADVDKQFSELVVASPSLNFVELKEQLESADELLAEARELLLKKPENGQHTFVECIRRSFDHTRQAQKELKQFRK